MSQTATRSVQTVSVLTLTGMVVGSIVGGGVFSLPADFGGATGALGAVIAWVVAGLGMLMLAFVFQSLAVRPPTWTTASTSTRRRASATTPASTPPGATGPATWSATSST